MSGKRAGEGNAGGPKWVLYQDDDRESGVAIDFMRDVRRGAERKVEVIGKPRREGAYVARFLSPSHD